MAQVHALAVSGRERTPVAVKVEGKGTPARRMDILSSDVRDLIKPQRLIPTFARDGSGYSGDIEEWHPPEVTDEQVREVEESIRKMEEALRPPEKGPLLTRVLALLSHYRAEANPPQVERMMAEDWAEDLQDYPMEVIEQAARWWRRNKKFRPAICEIRDLCEDAIKEERVALERMRVMLARHYAKKRKSVGTSSLQVIAAQSCRSMPSVSNRGYRS